MPDPKNKKQLKIRGKCVVYIDWANVHGWEKSLGKRIDPKKLYCYLKSYKQIKDCNFYFGTDSNPKSKSFIRSAGKIGYSITTKPVKYMIVGKFDDQIIRRRKCDFDIEICIQVHKDLSAEIDSFVFFSGDGDFEPLYQLLVKERKQVIVIYSPGHLGKEVWKMKKGIFKVELENLINL